MAHTIFSPVLFFLSLSLSLSSFLPFRRGAAFAYIHESFYKIQFQPKAFRLYGLSKSVFPTNKPCREISFRFTAYVFINDLKKLQMRESNNTSSVERARRKNSLSVNTSRLQNFTWPIFLKYSQVLYFYFQRER